MTQRTVGLGVKNLLLPLRDHVAGATFLFGSRRRSCASTCRFVFSQQRQRYCKIEKKYSAPPKNIIFKVYQIESTL